MATQGSRKLDKASYQKINRALEEFDWDLKRSPKELGDWEKNENAEVSQKVYDNLGKVQNACNKAYGEARKIYSSISRLPRHDVLAVPIAEKLKEDFEASRLLVQHCIPHWGPTSRRGPGSRLEPRTGAWNPAWNSGRRARSRVLH